MFVETNLGLAALSGSHTNSAIMSGKDAGDMVEEYQQAYMTKEKGGLKCSAAVMLTALNDIEKYPSVAEDTGTHARQAKYLATRTVNAFAGATEWSHSLMAYALAGNRSYISSESFWFIFPHDLVKYVDYVQNRDRMATDEEMEDTMESISVQSRIDELIDEANNEDVSRAPREQPPSSSGARMFKVNGEIILVTHAISYRHRGVHFEAFSPLEFEMIVDVLPRSEVNSIDIPRRGRPKRAGFDLAPDHPLATTFQGFIRTKFRTAMLGGAPPPRLTKDGQASTCLSKYILCMMLPWREDTGAPDGELTPDGLVDVCKRWNCSSASFVNRQRYRFMENILQKGYRCASNEMACSEWRSRNAAFWSDPVLQESEQNHSNAGCRAGLDCSNDDSNILASEADLYALTTAAAAKDRLSIASAQALRATFWSLIPDCSTSELGNTRLRVKPPIYEEHLAASVSLKAVTKSITSMSPLKRSAIRQGVEEQQHQSHPLDPYAIDPTLCPERERCSPDQQEVFDRVISHTEHGGRLRQNPTILHGGGGTGKSTLIRAIVDVLERHGIDTLCTCPTGIGASHLKNGRTFHSAFKAFRKGDLSENDLALLRLSFTDRLQFIVVDEMSMLSTEFLDLLDKRLRQVYRNNIAFGGRSIMLVSPVL